jgi:hypothetical protein
MISEEKQEDNNGSDQQFKVFKDFDFLDIELDSQEGEAMDKFNLALKRHSFGSLEGIMESNAPESQSTQSSVREESSDDEVRVVCFQMQISSAVLAIITLYHYTVKLAYIGLDWTSIFCPLCTKSVIRVMCKASDLHAKQTLSNI